MATAGGSGVSGKSFDRSCSQPKNRYERSSLMRDVIPDRAAQHRVAGFECIEDRALRRYAGNVECHFLLGVRKSS